MGNLSVRSEDDGWHNHCRPDLLKKLSLDTYQVFLIWKD